MSVGFHRVLKLIKALRDVTLWVKIIWSDLSDVKVNQVTVVTIEFKQFVSLETSCVDIVLYVDVLMWENVVRLSVFVTGSLNVVNFEIGILLGLIHCEVKVLASDNFLVGCICELLLIKLIFKVLEDKFLFDDLVNL